MSDEQKKQLEQQLWNIANTLRGKMNADEFRDYILGFIFYKYLAEKMEIFANEILKQDKISFRDIKLNDPNGKEYIDAIREESLEKLGYYKVSKQEFGFFESIPFGVEKGKDQLLGYGKQLKMIFNPETKAYKQVGGFAAIFNIFPNTWSWEVFWNITALLSIMLGVMNLLPIPALDGGHVMFLLYEIISGKKPSDKFLENAQMVGFVLLISLLLFANGNDIYKAIVGK